MKTMRSISIFFLSGLLLFVLPGSHLAAARSWSVTNDPLAVVVSSASQVEWQIQINNDGADLIVIGPNHLTFQKTFSAGVSPVFSLLDEKGQQRGAGTYQYELNIHPLLDPQVQTQLENVRGTAQEAAVIQNLKLSGKLPQESLTQSGSFWLSGEASAAAIVSSSSEVSRTDNTLTPQDAVTADNAIIQGSLCVGVDCISGESFGFDTIRLKENNLRIKFDDTSAAAGFPFHDWQLTANDSASGGLDRFTIEDITAATMPFYIVGGAPTNALVVSANGKIGLHTSTPVLDLHVVTGNTPAMRLEQNTSGGFSAQTWDIAGNEANFFIRDVTSGSKLPFRIRPGAPTSSIDISASGNVGVGTASPQAKLDVRGNVQISTQDTPALRLEKKDGSDSVVQVWEINGDEANFSILDVTSGSKKPFNIQPGAPTSSMDISTSGNVGIGTASPQAKLDVRGNVLVEGYVTELSDQNAKTNFSAVNGQAVLDQLKKVPVLTWNYSDDPSAARHMGPMAQSFYAAFGLGVDNKHLAALDTNGVALAAIQELNRQVEEKDAKINSLEARVTALEASPIAAGGLLQYIAPFAMGLIGMAAGAWITRRKPAC